MKRSPANRGRGFENAVELQLSSSYRGLVVARRIDTGAKAVRRGDTVRLVPTKSPPDFLGCLLGGRSIVFDVKSTAETHWSLDARAIHQVEFMSAWAGMGALCLFVVECRPLAVCAVLRVPHLRYGLLPPRPALSFITPGMCLWPHLVLPGEGGLYDWLRPALQRWPAAAAVEPSGDLSDFA